MPPGLPEAPRQPCPLQNDPSSGGDRERAVWCFSGPDAATGPESSSTSSFDRFMDSPAVEEALRRGCLACVRHVLASIRSELLAATSSPSPPHISSVLFVARLCQSIGELCPNLKHCVLGKHNSSETLAKGAPRQSKKAGKARTVTEVSAAQAAWASLSEELLTCSMEAYHVWSSSVTKVSKDAERRRACEVPVDVEMQLRRVVTDAAGDLRRGAACRQRRRRPDHDNPVGGS